MDEQTFLTQAAEHERRTETLYRKLVDLVLAKGRLDMGEFFHQMAEFSRQHLESVLQQAGMTRADLAPAADAVGKEIPDDLDAAMAMALASELRAVAFYEQQVLAATDGRVRQLATEYAAEERSHVQALERYMGLKPY